MPTCYNRHYTNQITSMEQSPQSSSIATPIAIIFGFGLIALAVYFSGIGRSTTSVAPTPEKDATTVSEIRPVDSTDFIKGNPNAPIRIVEYSDYDCPYCKDFHTTMTQIMNEYGVTGKVGWIYRQLPLEQLHPNSPHISEAALCVGEIGGNDAFWKFSDRIFKERAVNELTNITRIPEYAEAAGVDKAIFMTCLDSGRQKNKVADSVQDGLKAGIVGTPHSFVLVGNQTAAINGAQPYEVVKQIIENLLGQLEAASPQN